MAVTLFQPFQSELKGKTMSGEDVQLAWMMVVLLRIVTRQNATHGGDNASEQTAISFVPNSITMRYDNPRIHQVDL